MYRLLVLLLLIAVVGCDESEPDSPDGALFVVRTCADSSEFPGGETFRVLIRNEEAIAEAERLLDSDDQRIITGPLERGDGGFNAPWSWYLDPDSVSFADVTIEVCDGCPSFVEDSLDYWVDTVGIYCPWSTEIIDRE